MAGELSNWTHQEYEADVSRERSTRLKALISPQGPRLYYHLTQEPDQSGMLSPGSEDYNPKIDDRVMGILLHEFLLEGKKQWYVCDYRWGTRKWRDEADEHDVGMWALKTDQDIALMHWAGSVRRNPEARKIIDSGGFKEQAFLWTEEKYGIDCKCRVDLYAHSGMIVDVKTSRHLTRTQFNSQIAQLQYDFSAAFYERGRDTVLDTDFRMPFLHLVVCKKYPFPCYVWRLNDMYLDTGHRNVEHALERLRDCRDHERQILAAGGEAIDAWPDMQQVCQTDEGQGPPAWYRGDEGWNPSVDWQMYLDKKEDTAK